MISYQSNRMLAQAREARFQPKPMLQILLFFAVFGVGTAISAIVQVVPLLIGIFTDPAILSAVLAGNSDAAISAAMVITQQPWVMLLSLFATVITTLLCILYCCKLEKRSLVSMGLGKKNLLTQYLTGYAIGTVMLLLCALILWLTGDLDFAFAEKIPTLYLLAFFAGFLIQGMSEEVLVRGYLMVSLSNRSHMATAVGLSSVIFSLLHIFNPGITLIALLNIALFGVFMGVYILRTDNLWGACAIHSAWNFAQGNLVGIQVSGMTQLPTLAVMTPQSERALLHGGAFGLEGGLIATAVILAAIALTLFLPQKTETVADQNN